MTKGNLERRVVNYLALAVCAGGLIIGVAVMSAPKKIEWFARHPNVETITHEVGALVLVTALLAVFWELFAKRAFSDEILAKVGISKELLEAGVRNVTSNFNRGMNWDEHFHRAREVDIFFAYGGTWRNAHLQQLRELVQREGARLRIILPDHQDLKTIEDLARRFSYTSRQVVEKIVDSERAFRELATVEGCRARIEIWMSRRTPVFSSYRFDDVCVAALYHHKKDRGWVPAFTTVKGGYLFDFFKEDFEAMIDPGTDTSRQVFAQGERP